MNLASTRTQVTIAFALMLAAILIAIAAYVPWMRQMVMQTLGLKDSSVAINSCPLAQTAAGDDSDKVYFLSCGGIY